ncbi:FAD-dependent oxidoreductase [Streptomyces flaveus]|uniref:FAD-dependent oxidoreductase n=1 Tax=Streptomyces flaveus TaxID=66370 RepID=UPI003319D267
MSAGHDTDLLIVGAGPAGVAAAVMADSLGMHTVLIEAGWVGGKLHHIPALQNVPGSWQTGPALAQALAADIARVTETGRCRLVQDRAVRVAGHEDRADVVLANGQVLSAAAAVVATGVTSLGPGHVDWITAPDRFRAAPLWRAAPTDLNDVTHVLGADRPLGTWLRAHPDVRRTLNVLCPPEDDYKAAEVADDDRVQFLPIARVTIAEAGQGQGWNLHTENCSGESVTYIAGTVLSNLGNRPAALDGLVQGEDGYCPAELQHPRILTAGDLGSARFQRIVTAQGAGAKAALARYYDTALAGA